MGRRALDDLVLLPGSVEECYEFARDAFDYADRFQTPVFVLSDLDLGMNLWMTPEFKYPEKKFDRGKVLSKDDLDRLAGEWARYRDVDGDGVSYRTLPGTDHPAAGYFTRGSGHDEMARYTESADAYARNMDRLARKLETARHALPAPVVEESGNPIGLIAFGSSHAAIVEARQTLAEAGKAVDYLRVRALPLSDDVAAFVSRHEHVYVVEQNRVGQLRDAYKGAATTLCAGCGHNSITNHMIKALYELGVEPHMLAKMSGIGCSSKTPAYFVETAHGFNGVHGRMPALTTGAHLANRQLIMLGVSGDGDTASIGLGQFMHLIRRNVDCTYIIEDNGTYGLTKGQFSATADLGSVQKKGAVNTFQPIDPCAVALTLGCSFVARSFSGDGKQVVPLIKAAIAHRGTAILDIVSPCVTFNDHDGSTKSYSWVKDHEESIADVSFIPFFEEVHVDYEPGTVRDVELNDGSHILLKKLGEDHDPTDRRAAMKVIEEGRSAGHLVTGLLYLDPASVDFATTERIPESPLVDLGEDQLRLTPDEFAQFMAEFA